MDFEEKNAVLGNVLVKREREYDAALDTVRGVADSDPRTWEAYLLLSEAVETARCMRRVLPILNIAQVHHAFGAPGDFGYETPIGDALSRLYRSGP